MTKEDMLYIGSSDYYNSSMNQKYSFKQWLKARDYCRGKRENLFDLPKEKQDKLRAKWL